MMRARAALAFVLLCVLPSAARAVPDLEEAREIRFLAASAPDVAETAARLGSPVRIYEYVLNEFEYLPYYGVRSGAQNALWRKGGNDVDLAALLIAMLRSRGVRARYANGDIVVPDAALASWLGVATRAQALSILNSNRVPVVSSAAGSSVELSHVWVEALLPISNYRGIERAQAIPACADESADCKWIALDPSFKQHTITPPDVDTLSFALTFDYARYYNAIKVDDEWVKNKNPAEILQQNILAANPGRALSDIVGSIAIIPVATGVLPGSLPYQVNAGTVFHHVSAAARDGLAYNDTNNCPDPVSHPDAWTRCLRLQLVVAGPGSATLRDVKAPIDRIATKDPIWTLIAPAASLASCGAGATSCDKVSLKYPGLPSPLVTHVQLQPGQQYQLIADAYVQPSEFPVNATYDVFRNNTYVLVAAGIEANATQVAEATDAFLSLGNGGRVLSDAAGLYVDVNANGTYENPPDTRFSSTADQTRALLYLAGRSFAHKLNGVMQQIAGLTQTRVDLDYQFGFVSSQTDGTHMDGAPFAIVPTGLLLDVLGGAQKPYRLPPNSPVALYPEVAKLLVHAGSSLEHEVWQELTGFDAISAVRGFQKALFKGASLVTVRGTGHLGGLYDAMGFSPFPPFEHLAYDIFGTSPPHPDDPPPPFDERPNVWRSTPGAIFSMFQSTVSTSTSPLRRSAVHYYTGPFSFYVSAQQVADFLDIPTAPPIQAQASWADLVACFDYYWKKTVGKRAGDPVIPENPNEPLPICLTRDFRGRSMGQLRTSLANQYAFAKAELNRFTGNIYGLTTFDMASYVDSHQGFVAEAMRYRAEPDASLPRLVPVGLVTRIRDDFFGLTSPEFTSGEYVLPSARIVEQDTHGGAAYLVWYEFKDAPLPSGGSLWLLATTIQQSPFSAGGGYVIGDEGYADWTVAVPEVQQETVSYDNRYHTDQVLVPDANNSPRSSSTGDPVSTATGNMFHDETDFVLPGQPFDFAFTRTYNSRLSRAAQRFTNRDDERFYWPLGPGWTHSYAMLLISNDFGERPNFADMQSDDGVVSSITFVDERGGELNFPIQDCPGACTARSPAGFFGTLKNPVSDMPSIEFPDGRRYLFRSMKVMSLETGVAVLERIEDADGRSVKIEYVGEVGSWTQRVTDEHDHTPGALNHTIELRHTDGRLTSVVDWTGRTWTYQYDFSAGSQRLTGVTNPLGHTTNYSYQVGPEALANLGSVAASGGAVYRLTDVLYPPRSVAEGTLQRSMAYDYFTNGRAASTTDALGHVERYDYNLFRRSTAVTDPRGFVRTHVNDERGGLQTLVQQDGNLQKFASTVPDNLRYEKRDAYGRATQYSYASTELVGSDIGADRGGNVTLEYDAAGGAAHYTYEAKSTTSGREGELFLVEN